MALIDQLIASEFRNIDPATPDLGAGPERFRRNFTLYTTAFPNAHFVIDEVVDGGVKSFCAGPSPEATAAICRESSQLTRISASPECRSAESPTAKLPKPTSSGTRSA